MKSQPNSDSSPRNGTYGQAQSSSQPATVPLSLYRELAAELQATKAMLDSINGQNQQLARQNQRFRHEIERLMQVSLNLQQIAGLPQAGWVNPSGNEHATVIPDALNATALNPSSAQPQVAPPQAPPPRPVPPVPAAPADDLFAEQSMPAQNLHGQAASAREFGGFWLWVTVFVIIITAFGAGFMIVKPLLQNNR